MCLVYTYNVIHCHRRDNKWARKWICCRVAKRETFSAVPIGGFYPMRLSLMLKNSRIRNFSTQSFDRRIPKLVAGMKNPQSLGLSQFDVKNP